MMIFFRRLAKPFATMSLVGFIGQLLLTCCMSSGVANASIDTVVGELPPCHQATQDSAIHYNTKIQSQGQAVDCCHDTNSHNKSQPLLTQASHKLIDDAKQADQLATISHAPTMLGVAAILSLAPTPNSERNYTSSPIYLSNCSFLE